jgi:hypothetical protein
MNIQRSKMKDIIDILKNEVGITLPDFEFKNYSNLLNDIINHEDIWSSEILNDFLLNTMILIDNVGLDKFFNILASQSITLQDDLKEIINNYAKNHKRTFNIRKLSLEAFKALIDEIFISSIYDDDDLPRSSILEPNEILLLSRLMRWSIEFIIIKKINQASFCKNLFNNFGFQNDFSIYIYDKIKSNKKDLYQFALFERINRMNSDIQEIKKTLKNLNK